MIILLMGVSSCGKTTLGKLLSEQLHWPFYDGDSYHSPEAKEKMRSGKPLTDEDRMPWLQRLAQIIVEAAAENKSAIVACSALRASYRRILKGESKEVVFVHLKGSKELIQGRIERRVHEYMNPNLLESQFETLEDPDDAVSIDIDESPEEIARSIRSALGI